jgi:hypothetical protein
MRNQVADDSFSPNSQQPKTKEIEGTQKSPIIYTDFSVFFPAAKWQRIFFVYSGDRS